MKIRRFNENMKKYQRLLEDIDEILQVEVFDDYDCYQYTHGVGRKQIIETKKGRLIELYHPRLGIEVTDMKGNYKGSPPAYEVIGRGPAYEFIAISIDFHWQKMSTPKYMTQMPRAFNNTIKRILAVTGLVQYNPSMSSVVKNKISGVDFKEGLDGEFIVDWRYPFEQELSILMEDEPEIIRFDVLLA